MGVAGEVSSGVVAVLLMLAGIWKLARPRETAESWRQHEVIPTSLVPFAVAVIAIVEIVVAGLVLLPSTRRVAALAAVALFLAYTVYLLVVLRRGGSGECACFGSDQATRINGGHVIRAAVFAALAGVGILDRGTDMETTGLLLGLVLGVALMLASSLLTAVLEIGTGQSEQRS